MANEITVRSELQVKKGGVDYRSFPNDHRVTAVGTANGPTPGSLLIGTTSTYVDLTQLTTPGVCRVRNLDATNYVEFGIYDGSTFFPLGEIGPLEQYVFKFSRNVSTSFRMKANTAACRCLVEAFER